MTKFRMALAILITTIPIPFGASMVQASVSLEDFDGSWTASDGVVITFETGSENEHAAMHVWRSTTDISPDDVNNTTATRLTTQPIIGQNACSASGGATYDYPDTTASASVATYYYFLESISCNGPSEFYGDDDRANGGLRLNNPSGSGSATNTPTATTGPSVTPGGPSVTPQNTATRTATSAPNATNAPVNTPGPTGTLIPLETEVVASATPRPTNTSAPVSTTAPAPTQANTQTNPPTEAPVEQPTQAPPPTEAPPPTNPPADTTGETVPVATDTPAPIAAVASPLATEAVPEGEMSSGQPAPTPTLGGGLAESQGLQGTGINSVPGEEDPIVASSSDGDGVDGLIQGLIGVILVGAVGLVGFIGWNYMRNR